MRVTCDIRIRVMNLGQSARRARGVGGHRFFFIAMCFIVIDMTQWLGEREGGNGWGGGGGGGGEVT